MTQLCVSSYCGLPRQHLDDCDEEECRGCLPARAADGLYLCLVDLRHLEGDAVQLAEMYEELGLRLTGGGRPGEKTSGSKGSVGTDLNPAAVEARSAIRAALVRLTKLIAEERGIGYPPDEVPAMGDFVAKHADWLAAHEAADEHAEELRDLATDYRTWRLAYPVSSDRLYIGECPLLLATTDGARKVCGTKLYQLASALLVTCQGCEKSETVEWWQREITGEAGGVVDAYAGAAHLSVRWRRPVDPGTVRKWGQRATTGVEPVSEPVPGRERDHLPGCTDGECDGCLRQLVRDGKGRALYRLDQLTAYARKTWGPPWDEPRDTHNGAS
jgi:hypothetical protein